MVSLQNEENSVSDLIREEIKSIRYFSTKKKDVSINDLVEYKNYFKRLKFAYKNFEDKNIICRKIKIQQKKQYAKEPFAWVQYYKPKEVQQTVILVHGLGMHTSAFAYLIPFLVERGIEVYAIDLPYHGLSYGQGKFGDIINFEEYFDAVQSVFDHVEKNSSKKISLISHSTGGTAVLGFLNRLENQKKIAMNIMIAPLVKHSNNDIMKFLSPVISLLLRRLSSDRAGNIPNQDFKNFRKDDILTPLTFSVNWAKKLYLWQRDFSFYNEYNENLTPSVIFQGTKDSVVDWKYNIAAIQEKYQNVEVVYLENQGHSILYGKENVRSGLYQQIISLLRKTKL